MSTHAHDFSPPIMLTVLPVFHVGGCAYRHCRPLHAGATVTLHARFDAAAWIADVAARRPSMSLLVPATLRAVLEHPDFAAADLSSLKLLNAGSSTIPESLIAGVHARSVPCARSTAPPKPVR